jgi:hypothetical protein
MTNSQQPRLTREEWIAAAKDRYGENSHDWKFRCPSCGHVASVKDWKDAKAPEGAVAFSCVGRYSQALEDGATSAFKGKGGPCNYTGGGLFKLNPVTVVAEDGSEHTMFDFADRPLGGPADE